MTTAGMPDVLELAPARAARGSVALPGSKSISNRVLLLAAVADGVTEITGLLDADDTRVMRDALTALGVEMTPEPAGTVRTPAESLMRVRGVGGLFPVKKTDLFLGNAGTALRPLTAVLAISRGEYHVSGVPRMHERPIGDLVDALRALGASIDYLGTEGYPPLAIHPAVISTRGVVRVRGDVSSQFLTALLMMVPLLHEGVQIEIEGELISKPYVEITLNVMQRFRVRVARDGWRAFGVHPSSRYTSPGRVRVEADASAASYFLAAGAVGGGPVRVEGVGRDSIQGDVRFVEVLERVGARVSMGESWIECTAGGPLVPFDLDLNHIPDAAMTAAVLALFANGTSTIHNVGSWRVKETDRLAAMSTELRKLGATVEQGADFLRITPGPIAAGATIDTYDDHRMAMSFSLACLAGVPVRINDPACVAKTYPAFFDDFRRILVAR